MKSRKFRKILDLKDKIPTAAQIRKCLKDEWHSWTDLEKVIAATILLPTDVSICISSDDTLLNRFGEDADINAIKESSHLRLATLDTYLENLTIDIQQYEDYSNGIKKTPEGDFPLEFKWSLKRHNDYVKLMNFIHEIDSKREWEYNKFTEIKLQAPSKL